MIKTAVFSDTHGHGELMLDAVRRTRPDVVIHLGDGERDTAELRREFPTLALYTVRGNCDIAVSAPDWDVVPLGGVKAFITHGHLYDVNWGTDRLVYAAMEQGASLALYGHTHRADYSSFGSVTVINPGTAGRGRELTWAYIETFDNGTLKAEIRDL